MATREVPLEKNVERKCMQVSVLKSVTRMTKRGGGIRTDYMDRRCQDTLGTNFANILNE